MRASLLALILTLVITLVIIAPCTSQEDVILFADDYYKALTVPQLAASPLNPVLESGSNQTLRIILANQGYLQELIPTGLGEGDAEIAERERQEERHSLDIYNLLASLRASPEVVVTSPPTAIAYIPAGGLTILEYSVRGKEGASGPVTLELYMEYERQIDVKISGDGPMPLFLPANVTIPLVLQVRPISRSFSLEYADANLDPGKNGTIVLILRNLGSNLARNCTAYLASTNPVQVTTGPCPLGDISPGGLALAQFHALVPGNATSREYTLSCEVQNSRGRETLSVPVSVTERRMAFLNYLLLLLVISVSVLGIYRIYRARSSSRRRSSRTRWSR